jgi:hypothetical protein
MMRLPWRTSHQLEVEVSVRKTGSIRRLPVVYCGALTTELSEFILKTLCRSQVLTQVPFHSLAGLHNDQSVAVRAMLDKYFILPLFVGVSMG